MDYFQNAKKREFLDVDQGHVSTDGLKRQCLSNYPTQEVEQCSALRPDVPPPAVVAEKSVFGQTSSDVSIPRLAPQIDDSERKAEPDTCFGMIQLTAPNLRLDALGNTNKSRIDVILKTVGRVITIRNADSMAYGGLLERKISEPLVELSECYVTIFVTFILLQRKRKNLLQDYKLCVMVQGLRQDADGVGELLSKAELYLQPPQGVRPSVPYFNPQYLYRPCFDVSTVQSQNTFGQSATDNTFLRDDDPLKHRVLQVFDAAQGPRTYSEVKPSSRLRTPLKLHQSKALSMMMERETGRLLGNEFGTMWSPFAHLNGQTRYRNTVTGIVQFGKPSVCLGGLLADEMGLGKTLSMLALITSQLDGREHMEKKTPESDPDRTTLIVTPMSLLQTWEEQIKRHINPGTVSHYVYHGSSRKKSQTQLGNFDIVLTTYDTLVAEVQNRSDRSKSSKPLQDLKWCRIVLDEAHMIRNASSRRHTVLKSLKARHRWCLTGSPMFNRVEDYGALLGFLSVPPFHDPSFFNSQITNLLKREPERALETLRKLVQSTSLRRTKTSILSELEMPPRMTRVQEVLLGEIERKEYDVLKKSYSLILEAQSPTNQGSKAASCIFQTISRLRQFCDHGRHLLPPSALSVFEDSTDELALAKELLDASKTCTNCKKAVKPRKEEETINSSLEYGYLLCTRCEKKTEEDGVTDTEGYQVPLGASTPTTTVSQTPSSSSPFPPSEDAMDVDPPYTPSSKVIALVDNLRADRTEQASPPLKSVVFSCWTKMLDQVEKALNANSLPFERIDGSKSDSQRRTALDRFRGHAGYCILLASIGSAGVGLDLTTASRVHMIEPQWSPMAEEQALDRVHRMGQMREVVATRYVVKDSIEEYVVLVQEMKSRIIKQSFEREGGVENLSPRERFLKYLAKS